MRSRVLRLIGTVLAAVQRLFKTHGAELRACNLLAAQRMRTAWTLGGWIEKNVDHGGDRKSTFRGGRLIGLPEGVSWPQSHRFQRLVQLGEGPA